MFERILKSIKRKIYMLISRAVVTSVANTGLTQRIQLQVMADEVVSNLEHFEEYGFSSFPFVGSEALTAFINGNRSHGIVIKVHDRRYRPTDLAEGEVAIYTDEDQSSPFHHIHLKNGNIIEVKSGDIDFVCTRDVSVTCDNIDFACNDHSVSGECAFACAKGAGRRLADERIIDLFNNHRHSGISIGGNNSGVPTTAMVEASHFTANTEAL